MKKRAVFLLSVMLAFLWGCNAMAPLLKEPVSFYYLKQVHTYGREETVIASELHEASGHRDDLSYLLSLYLMGPSSSKLVSPVSRGTKILQSERMEDEILLTLSDTSSSMSDVDFSKACACLTLTCLNLTDAQKVIIKSGSRSASMTLDTVILSDRVIIEEAEEQQ